MKHRLIMFLFIVSLLGLSVAIDTYVNNDTKTIRVISNQESFEYLVLTDTKIKIYLLNCYDTESNSNITLKVNEELFKQLSEDKEYQVEVSRDHITQIKQNEK